MNDKRRRFRRGVAAVELAITLPILASFVFGSIEVCNLIFLRQALVTTTYEAARVAVRSNATHTSATASARAVLTAREISGATITFSVDDVAEIPRGTPFSATVTAPVDAFSILPVLNLTNTTITVSTSMVKE